MRRLLQENRVYIWSALSTTVILLTIFKLIYPYPNMVLDSYYYILAAISRADVNAWAIGYSWFLRAFAVFSHSPLLLVIFQYLFLGASFMVFFLTLAKFFGLSKVSKWLLFLFLFANPLFLYCANFVMADALFVSLSVFWVSLLLWIVFKPNIYLLWAHTALILLVFVVRYNALYYPAVAAVAFTLSGYPLRQKILGIVLQIFVIGAFIGYTSMRVGEISGKSQFSPFGNWKMANDALYMYGHIYQEEDKPVPEKFIALHQLVRGYFQSGAKVDDLLDYGSPFYGSSYMFFRTSPLLRYSALLYGDDTAFVNFKKMAGVGPLYGEYGAYLIRQHPLAFGRYFVVPNVARYFLPPMEAFASPSPFLLRTDNLGQSARSWFGVHTLAVSASAIRLRDYILSPYQVMAGFIHLLFILHLIGFVVVKGVRSLSRPEGYALLLLTSLWICDLGFNLLAAATVMRYELFLLIVEVSLVLRLAEKIYGTDNKGTTKLSLS